MITISLDLVLGALGLVTNLDHCVTALALSPIGGSIKPAFSLLLRPLC